MRNEEFHYPDRLGTKLVTNNQANSAFEQSTLPFGTALDAEAVGTNTTNQRFTSYDRSQVASLDYAVNRSYSPAQGRFTQVDPIGMNAASLSNPQTLNMYAYCGNDPINNTDPDGLFFGKLFGWLKKNFKWIAIAVSVATLVALTVFQPWTGGFFGKLVGVLVKVNNAIGAVHISPFVVGAPTFFAGAEITGMAIGGYIAGAVIPAVGAISNSFARGKKRIRDENDYKWGEAFRISLWVLQKIPECANYIADNIKGDKSVNTKQKLWDLHQEGRIRDFKEYLIRGSEGLGVAETKIEKGGPMIYLSEAFYLDTFWKSKNLEPRKGRAMVLLHELKHALGGDHTLDGTQKNYQDNLLKRCLSKIR